MNKKQFILTLIFTIFFAFIGGVLSTQLFLGHEAFAFGPEKILIAEEFRLVDRVGITRAVLNTTENPLKTNLTLFDPDGHRRILFIVDGNGNPSAHFWDKDADGEYEPVDFPSISFWVNNSKLRARIPIIID